MLIGGEISIHDTYMYICAIHESVPVDHTLASTGRCLCSGHVAIGFKTSTEAYSMEKTVLGHWSCTRLANYTLTFEQSIFSKIVRI